AVFFAIIGLIGTREIAAMNVVLAVIVLPILAAAGIGMAATTLVGTALGRGDAADAGRWGWQVASVGSLGILAFSALVLAAPGAVLGLMISDQPTLALATPALRLLAAG